jgi:ABC-2 type transport system permease protein
MRTLLVASNDLRRRIRNRSALITAFVGPLAMAVVFSLLIGGADSASFRIGMVDADGSPIARELTGSALGTHGNGAVSVVRRAGVDETRKAIDDGELNAAIVVPKGFGAAVASGRPATMTVLRSPDRLVSGQVAESVATQLVAHVEQVGLAMRLAAARTGRPPDPALADAAHRRPPALALADVPRGGHEASPGAFYGAAMSILFLFFTVGYGARSLLAERRGGTLGRILATPTSAGTVVAGKTLAVTVLGLAGFGTVWAVTALAFGARWGDPVAVAVVIVATVLAVGGVSTLVASLARTDQQADAYTSAVTFVFALLGGNFVGPGAAPELLRQLSMLTPNGWSLAAFTDLSADAASLSSVLGAVGVLLAVAVVTGTIGLHRIHRVVAQ